MLRIRVARIWGQNPAVRGWDPASSALRFVPAGDMLGLRLLLVGGKCLELELKNFTTYNNKVSIDKEIQSRLSHMECSNFIICFIICYWRETLYFLFECTFKDKSSVECLNNSLYTVWATSYLLTFSIWLIRKLSSLLYEKCTISMSMRIGFWKLRTVQI